MASKTKIFGYWISCVDEESAKEAVKMAGLPVLLMGGNAALTALIALSQQSPDLTLATSCAAISLPLIAIAFRIRAEKSGWIPSVVVLFAAFLILSALSGYVALMDVGIERIGGVQIVTSWIVPLICSVLMVAGFKGWLWLKTKGLPRPL
ncbi:hypothetical protein QTO30_07095 [Yoonia sp. GPGPB17]|uniref:hypothetical protein n=1 Tax=Yoonia sp. GPGPB17 TaxID=3026147 RepID=UPI0030C356C2